MIKTVVMKRTPHYEVTTNNVHTVNNLGGPYTIRVQEIAIGRGKRET